MSDINDWIADGTLSPIVLLIFGALLWQVFKDWRGTR